MNAFLSEWLGRVYPGDCLDFMRWLPDKCVDAVVTDPPYGIDGGRGGSGSIGASRSRRVTYQGFDDTEQYIIETCVRAIEECRRIAKCVILTPGNRYLTHYPKPDSFGVFWQPAGCGVQSWGWVDAQPIFYYGKAPHAGKSIKHLSMRLTEVPEKNGHPCPKPIKAWQWLLQLATDSGGVVFDPFLGSGTTAVACERLGRRWLGCEINESYVAIAEKRIAAERAKGKLNFDEPALVGATHD